MAAVPAGDVERTGLANLPSGWKGIARFYDSVGVRGVDAQGNPVTDGAESSAAVRGWQVLIQGRALRTNALNNLVLPTKGLALAIAAEFGLQGSKINPAGTPLYNLACQATDTYLQEELAEADRAPVLRPRLDAFLKERAASILRGELQDGDEGEDEHEFDDDDDATRTEKRAKLSLHRERRRAEALAGESTALSPAERRALGWSWPLYEAASVVATEGLAAPLPALSAVLGAIPALAQPALAGALGVLAESETIKLRELAKDFLETDTACFRVSADRSSADVMLRRKQDRHYDPLLEWFADHFGVSLGVSEALLSAGHAPEAYAVVEDFVDRADPFLRAAFNMLLGTCKSSTTALALLHRHISIDQAFDAARVEEEFQIEENGFVEDGHDTARIETKLRISAASAFLWLLPQSAPTATDGSFAVSDAARLQADRASEDEDDAALDAELRASDRSSSSSSSSSTEDPIEAMRARALAMAGRGGDAGAAAADDSSSSSASSASVLTTSPRVAPVAPAARRSRSEREAAASAVAKAAQAERLAAAIARTRLRRARDHVAKLWDREQQIEMARLFASAEARAVGMDEAAIKAAAEAAEAAERALTPEERELRRLEEHYRILTQQRGELLRQAGIPEPGKTQ